jgi:hypothetical protein
MQSPPPIEPTSVVTTLPKQPHSSKNGRGKPNELKFNNKKEVSPFRKGSLEASQTIREALEMTRPTGQN